jgi:G3E family GTPase
MNAPLKNIATNVITGFLGVGKTTAILNLLKHKPEHERWSVLVNEAGKIGVDGKVMQQSGIAVKQVPGGCMCCAAGLPMQVAVNQLLIETRPHRLLIEPSGMGHPRNILKTLAAKEYDGVLDLRACICLVDPRNLSDERYLDSDLFRDQIAIADVLIANKTDQCTTTDRERFDAFVATLPGTKLATAWVTQGEIRSAWLDLLHRPDSAASFRPVKESVAGFTSFSTSFADTVCFDQECLSAFLDRLQAERVKAVVKTDRGVIFINSVKGQTSISAIQHNDGFLLEIVSRQALDETLIRKQLAECQMKDS